MVGGRGKPANIFLDTRSRLRQWCSGAHLFEAPGPCLARIIRRGAEELQARAAPAGPEDAGRGLREGVPARIIVAFSNFPPPFATFGCGDPQIISTSLARRLDLHLLFCAGDAFWLDCAPAYIFFFSRSLSSRRVYIFLSFQLWCHSGLPEWR